jgi:hypothetical protein
MVDLSVQTNYEEDMTEHFLHKIEHKDPDNSFEANFDCQHPMAFLFDI